MTKLLWAVVISLVALVLVFIWFGWPPSGRKLESKQPTQTSRYRMKTRPVKPGPIEVPILLYHYIRQVENPDQDQLGVSLSVSPQELESQLDYLELNGYHPISLVQLDRAIHSRTSLPNQPVILTFDDGYADFYDQAFPALTRKGFPAVVFMVAGFVDNQPDRYLTSEQIKILDQSGLITIGVHSLSHANLTNQKTNLEKEVFQAKKRLETIVGRQLDYFAYPSGKYSETVINSVRQAGFRLAFSTDQGTVHTLSNKYKLPRNRVGSSINSLVRALKPNPRATGTPRPVVLPLSTTNQ